MENILHEHHQYLPVITRILDIGSQLEWTSFISHLIALNRSIRNNRCLSSIRFQIFPTRPRWQPTLVSPETSIHFVTVVLILAFWFSWEITCQNIKQRYLFFFFLNLFWILLVKVRQHGSEEWCALYSQPGGGGNARSDFLVCKIALCGDKRVLFLGP